MGKGGTSGTLDIDEARGFTGHSNNDSLRKYYNDDYKHDRERDRERDRDVRDRERDGMQDPKKLGLNTAFGGFGNITGGSGNEMVDIGGEQVEL